MQHIRLRFLNNKQPEQQINVSENESAMMMAIKITNIVRFYAFYGLTVLPLAGCIAEYYPVDLTDTAGIACNRLYRDHPGGYASHIY